MRAVNPHELDYIFASSNPTPEDVRNLQEKYQNLLDYMTEYHKPASKSLLKEREHSFALFDTIGDLEGLKKRIEHYASIHHISLT
jgi:hypothetical protein